MSDQRNTLQSMFREADRHSNFGDVLVLMHVQGFRCHNSTIVDIKSPITAICGLNGTGKSTLLQLAAVSYKSPNEGNARRYYVKDFIVAGTLDPDPFTPNASVEFGYWQDDRSIRRLTLFRSDPTKRWQGYKRLPSRYVFFAGVGLYLPKVEQRDFIVRHARSLVVTATHGVPERTQSWTSQTLGYGYDQMNAITVHHRGQEGDVLTVKRSGAAYSEANMGYGEGRTQHLIRALETLPDKSLILVEEPETSLHPSAQHEFGKYLVNVAIVKRHQIFLTTHSEYLLKALPSDSRVFLERTSSGIRPIYGLTAMQATSLMTGGHDKALHVLVEDDVAKEVLCEIVRRSDPTFLKTIKIHPIGDSRTINSVMSALKDSGLPVAAVRDGDQGDSPPDNIFKLPGALPPEKEMMDSPSVATFLSGEYAFDLEDFMASMGDRDHHEWLECLSENVSLTTPALIQQVAKAYVASLPESEVDPLVTVLKEAVRV